MSIDREQKPSVLVAAGAAALARAYPDRPAARHEYDAGLVYDAIVAASQEPSVQVTDEMLERAVKAFLATDPDWANRGTTSPMRAALEAALSARTPRRRNGEF